MDVWSVEDDEVPRVYLIRERITTSVVGAFRPKFIMTVDVTDDDVVADKKWEERCGEVLDARRLRRNINIRDDQTVVV